MKNNFIAKIIGASLAIAMMIGVGAGVNTFKEAKEVDAAENTVNLTLSNKNNIAATEAFPFNVTYSGTWTWSSPQVRTTDENATVTFSGNSSVASIKSIQIGCSSAGYAPAGTANNSYTTSVSTTTVTISGTGASSVTWTPGASARLKTYKITYVVSSAPTVASVSVSGNMTNKSYTTVQSWDTAGLTPSGTMSDETSYTGEYTWSFEPASPTAAVIANEKNEGTNFSVNATASAGGKSGSKSTSGISVQYATVAQLTSATPDSGDSDYVIAKGIVSQIGEINTNSGKYYATYYISDSGSQDGQYYVFKGKGIDNADITNSNDIKVGDTVVVYGKVTNYNGTTKEFKQGNYLLSLNRPASQDPVITITTPNIAMKVGDADVAVNANAQNVPEGGSVVWETGNTSIATIVQANETYKVHAVAPGSTTVTAKILNSSSQPVASNSITVSVTADALENGDTFVIKAVYSQQATYYMTGVAENLGTASLNREDAIVFTAVAGGTPGQFKFKYTNEYLNYTGSSNTVSFTEDGTSASALWTAIDNGSEFAVVNANANNRKLQFNYNSGNPRFACYTSAQGAIVIEKVIAPEVDTVTVVGNSSADGQDALSITKDFYYEVTYVDPSNAGHQEVSVTVLNSNDSTDGASVTTEPANGEFNVTFTANDTYTVTVTSLEDPMKSDSTTITIYNLHVVVLTDFNLFTRDSLIEGDYLITYNNKALEASVNGNYVQYEEITPNNDVVSIEDNSIVWHIAKSGEYFTIYNALQNKYLASTGSKNQAQLLADGTDDKALWSFTFANDTFEFINKYNQGKSINANLRENGTYGWACYSTSTGDSLSLYKKNAKSSTEDLTTNTELSYRYTKDGNNYTFSDISMRFGGYISKDLWNELDTENHVIEGFGVMFTSTNVVHEPDSIKSKAGEAVAASANNDYANTLVNFYMPKASMATPAEDGDDYYWNLFFSVDFDEISINKYYVAAAYIKVDGEYVFMKEVKYSVTSLAQDYLDHRNCDGTTAEGSLAKLASLSPAE